MPSPVVGEWQSATLPTAHQWICWPADLKEEETLGGKARNLLNLTRAGFPVPDWFVVLPGNSHSQNEDQPVPAIPPRGKTSLASQIEIAYRQLCPEGQLVAVRSSAQEEDSEGHSFAGQLRSHLFVKSQGVVQRVLDVWESARSRNVESYRRQSGISGASHVPAVIVQRMVHSHCSGVAFTADPVSGRRGLAVVTASHGTGSALVSGECDADTYQVDRNNYLVGRVLASDGSPVLTDAQIVAVAHLARRAQALFHAPQDIEWAIDSQGGLSIVQTRPITSLKDLVDPDGEARIWDNSNVVESYGGITTPLTFSFARNCYAEVYRQFCRLLRVPSATIAANGQVFRCMLGFIRGRLYYNLLNWYAVLAMLPGYRFNRAFMEQMMGVRERLPEQVLAVPERNTRGSRGSRLVDGLRMLRSAAALVKEHLVIDRNIVRFHQRVRDALGDSPPDLSQYRPDELVSLYRSVESQLLSAWDAPLINDFFAMIFYGLLRQLCARWGKEAPAGLQNDLLAGGGDMVSTQPARKIEEMADLLRSESGLGDVFRKGSRQEIERALAHSPALQDAVTAYLEKFGDRCEDELKLESPTLNDDPLPLYRSIGQLASACSKLEIRRVSSKSASEPFSGVREIAERRVAAAFSGSPLRFFIFRWVLRQCRKRVRDRENLRFERTRVFGRVRMIVVHLGHQLHALGALDCPTDVFFLEMDELLGYVEGTVSCCDLRGLSRVRKAERESWRTCPPPANRFETRGAVNCQANTFQPSATAAELFGEQRRGTGCSPGRLRGQVKIVRSTSDAPPPGSILVAERTDPSWVLLFPLAAGLLVERGSVLSHVSIVGREMRIPIVTSVPGLTSWLADDDWVEMDGRTGLVTRISQDRISQDRISQDKDEPVVTVQVPSSVSACVSRSPVHPPFSCPTIPENAVVRYGQCWEDADVVCAALDVKPGDTCLSVASGGDNTLALLAFAPERVLAVDTNPAQLACLALRTAAFQNLGHPEVLELLGWRPSQRRGQLFLRARCGLAPAYREFWEKNLSAIERGAVNIGRFEQYLRLFRRYVLPLIHGDQAIERLLMDRSPVERARFYREEWDTRIWRSLFKVFFSRMVMRRFGRDPSYFRYAEASLAARLLERIRHALVELPPSENPYLQWILLGEQATALPFALRRENFEAIRPNLHRLELRCSPVEDAVRQDGPFRRMNLSNVFEYMSAEGSSTLLKSIAEKSPPGARLAYWNMAVERRHPEWPGGRLRALTGLCEELFPQAKACFYRSLVIEEVL